MASIEDSQTELHVVPEGPAGDNSEQRRVLLFVPLPLLPGVPPHDIGIPFTCTLDSVLNFLCVCVPFCLVK